MDLTIYEDQTGFMHYPEKKSEKNGKIVNFFNNNVDLYIERSGGYITIYCHLIAYKASARPLGYYVIYNDIYSDKIFANLKKEIDKVLHKLELQPRSGHTDNMIFENIEKFDEGFQYYKEDIDSVREAIIHGKNLEYTAGNIEEISAFCKDILKTVANIKISISSTRSELGNVNILINKKQSESLKRSGMTELTINQYREILRDREKREKGEPGKVKIREGIDVIKKGADILRSVGYSDFEIGEEINNNIRNILGFPIYRERPELENIPTRKLEIIEKEQRVEIDQESTRSHIKIMILLIGMVTIIAAAVVVVMYPDTLPEGIASRIGLVTPTPVPTQNIEPTPIPTTTIKGEETTTNTLDNQTDNTENTTDVTKDMTNKTTGKNNDTTLVVTPSIIAPTPTINATVTGTSSALIPPNRS